ncbi:MAG: TetR/AcrR family transcriptional regulator [Lachnospiraceae bacterium]|nr:TetR/AcrR family transcriptional regulator [Lachnospiraceae bacterium]
MDLREKKTVRNINNAFLELRAKKPLEKITVKELAETAEISKATFYLHYKDVYDLSDRLQHDALHRMISDIDDPLIFINDPVAAHRILQLAFESCRSLLNILFSGAQESLLPLCIEQELKSVLFRAKPELRSDIQMNVRLSFLLMGVFHAYIQNCKQFDPENVSSALEELLLQYTRSSY